MVVQRWLFLACCDCCTSCLQFRAALQPVAQPCLPPTVDTLSSPSQLTIGDLEDLEDAGTAKPWYRRGAFWLSALSFAASLAFFVAGIVMVVVSPNTVSVLVILSEWGDTDPLAAAGCVCMCLQLACGDALQRAFEPVYVMNAIPPQSLPRLPQRLARFSVWRWCFFLGCWPPIYWGTRLLMWGLTKFAECRLFTARTAVYFLVGALSRAFGGMCEICSDIGMGAAWQAPVAAAALRGSVAIATWPRAHCIW